MSRVLCKSCQHLHCRSQKAGCSRSTVGEAIKALEFAGVLTWQNRITPDPGALHRPVRPARLARAGDPNLERLPVSRPESRRLRRHSLSPTHGREHQIKMFLTLYRNHPISSLEQALARFGAALAARTGVEQEAAG